MPNDAVDNQGGTAGAPGGGTSASDNPNAAPNAEGSGGAAPEGTPADAGGQQGAQQREVFFQTQYQQEVEKTKALQAQLDEAQKLADEHAAGLDPSADPNAGVAGQPGAAAGTPYGQEAGQPYGPPPQQAPPALVFDPARGQYVPAAPNRAELARQATELGYTDFPSAMQQAINQGLVQLPQPNEPQGLTMEQVQEMMTKTEAARGERQKVDDKKWDDAEDTFEDQLRVMGAELPGFLDQELEIDGSKRTRRSHIERSFRANMQSDPRLFLMEHDQGGYVGALVQKGVQTELTRIASEQQAGELPGAGAPAPAGPEPSEVLDAQAKDYVGDGGTVGEQPFQEQKPS